MEATLAKRLIRAAVVKLLSDDRRNYRVAERRVRLRVNTCWNNSGVLVNALTFEKARDQLVHDVL